MTTKAVSPMPASLNELEIKINEIIAKKTPPLPENVKEVLVQYGPYITLVLMIMALPALLGLLGLGAFLAPMAILGGARAGVGFGIGALVSIITIAMTIMALPGLFKRQLKSWRLMFWSSLVNALGALLKFDLGSLIIGTALSWYVLFQIRSYYK